MVWSWLVFFVTEDSSFVDLLLTRYCRCCYCCQPLPEHAIMSFSPIFILSIFYSVWPFLKQLINKMEINNIQYPGWDSNCLNTLSLFFCPMFTSALTASVYLPASMSMPSYPCLSLYFYIHTLPYLKTGEETALISRTKTNTRAKRCEEIDALLFFFFLSSSLSNLRSRSSLLNCNQCHSPSSPLH